MLYALLAVLAAFWMFPLVSFVDQLSSNGKNNALRIRIKRGPYQAAVYAQELYEFAHKWRRLQAFVDKREMEIMSHEIEVQTAVLVCGANETEYRHREAGGMVAYPWLRELGAAEIERRMKERSMKAREWAHQRRATLFAAKSR